MADIEGLAIAGEPQANINFYTGVLGQKTWLSKEKLQKRVAA